MAVPRVMVELSANSAKLVTEVEKANKAMGGMRKSAESMQKSLSLISASSIIYLGQRALNTAGQIYNFTKSVVNLADEIVDMARIAGMSITEFQRWNYVMKMNDVDTSTFTMGIKLLVGNMQEAAKGTGDSAAAFEGLGISITNSDGKLKSIEEILPELIIEFGQMENGTNKVAYATALFGRSGMAMIEVLSLEKEKLEKLRKEAEIYGTTTEEIIKRNADYKESFIRLGIAWDNMKQQLTPVIGIISSFIDELSKLFSMEPPPWVKVLWGILPMNLPGTVKTQWNKLGEILGIVKTPIVPQFGIEEGTADLRKKYPELSSLAKGKGKPGESWTIDTVIKMLEAEAEAKKALIELEKEWDKWLEGINKKLEEQNDLLIQSGIEGYAAVDKLNTEYAEEAEALGMTVYELERIREVLNQGIKDNEHFIDSLKEISTTWDDIGKEFSGTLTSNMSLLMSSTESWGEKFKKVGESILQTIMQIIAKQLIMNALFSDSKEGKGFLGGGSWVGSLIGGIGGIIKGYQHGTDYVPKTGLAMLHQGEAVIPAGKTGGEGEGGTVIIMNIEATDVDSFERKYGGSVNKIFKTSARKGGAARKNMRSYI